MITIPKKKIVILIILTIVVALWFTALTFWLTKVKIDHEKVPFGNLLLWEMLAAFFTLYALVKPWGWKKKFKSMSARQKITSKGENRFLILFCYLSFVAPLVYGIVLIIWGISFYEYLIFAGASVLDTLVWGVYTLRTSYGNVPKTTN